MSEDTDDTAVAESEIHPLVGVSHGYADEAGDTVVYEHAEDGNFVGWHKESASG